MNPVSKKRLNARQFFLSPQYSLRTISSKVWGRFNLLLLHLTIPTLLLLGTPGYVQAGDWFADLRGDPSHLPDRLMIRGGGAFIFGANTDITVNPLPGIGGSINYQDTLGGDDSSSAIRFDGLFRFTPSHSLGLSWYRVGLGGNRTLNEQIQIDGNIIDVGASTNSSLNINLYRLLYNYSFYHTDAIEIAFAPGLYMANIKFALSAQGSITPPEGGTATRLVSEEALTLPLPSLGILLNYHITPRLHTSFRSDFFYLSVGEYEGSMFEIYFGLEYQLFKHLAIGAAYDRLQADVTNNNDSGGFRVNTAFNLVYLYGTVYFFETPL